MKYERKVEIFYGLFAEDIEKFLNEHSEWRIVSINTLSKQEVLVVLEKDFI